MWFLRRKQMADSVSWRIVIPSILAVFLFAAGVFVVLIPSFKSSILHQKQKTIQQLTQSVHNTLAFYVSEVEKGNLTEAEAKRLAVNTIAAKRYGDQEQNYFWINDMHCRLVMHPFLPQQTGNDLSLITNPDGIQVFQKFVRIVNESGAGFTQYRWPWKNETSRIEPKIGYVQAFKPWGWVIGTGIYLTDVDAEVNQMIAKTATITLSILLLVITLILYIVRQNMKLENQRQTAVTRLRESEESYRALTENSDDVIMRFDREYRHLFTNSPVERQTGIPVQQFIGKTHRELNFPSELADQWESALEQVFTTRQRHRIEFQLPSNIWIDWLIIPEFSADGDVQTVITSARDITERKQIEQALQESEMMFRMLAETTTAIIFMIQDGRFTYISPAAEAITGYSRDELYAMDHFWEITDPDHFDFFQQSPRPFAETQEKPSHYEIKIHHKNGEARWLDLSSCQITYNDKPTIFGTCLDITDRKHAERQIHQAERMATLGQIVAGVAHEINNPNNFISLNLPVLRQYWQSVLPIIEERAQQEDDFQILNMPFSFFKEDILDLINNIEHGSQRIQMIINQLRDYVKCSQDEPRELQPLQDVVANAMKLVGKQLQKSINKIELDVDPDLPPLSINRRAIEQVLINMMINASHAASRQTGSQLKISVQRCHFDPSLAEIQIIDNGCGIPANAMDRIFDPFFTTKSSDVGTGLGLAMSKSIIDKHNGMISVDSQVGQGCCFTIQLPMQQGIAS